MQVAFCGLARIRLRNAFGRDATSVLNSSEQTATTRLTELVQTADK